MRTNPSRWSSSLDSAFPKDSSPPPELPDSSWLTEPARSPRLPPRSPPDPWRLPAPAPQASAFAPQLANKSLYIIRQNNRPLDLYYDNTLTCPVYHKLTYVFPYCLMLLLREDNSSPVIECVFVKRFPIPDMLQHILNISGVFIHLWVFPWDLNIQFSSTL